MLYCYLHLAARRKEIFMLRWHDIDFESKKIRLYTRKRKDGSLEFDWLPLTDFLYRELLTHRKQSDMENELVFPNPKNGGAYYQRDRWMKRLCLKAEVSLFGLHAIRHLSASILIENDVAMIDVKTILRHKSMATTERYIHRLKSVRQAMSVFDIPRGEQLGDENHEGSFRNEKPPE